MQATEREDSIPSVAPDQTPGVSILFGHLQVNRQKYDYFLNTVLGRLQDVTERHTWNPHTEFTVSLISYVVGLGNIWRFPYLTYNSGGGAFLVPYLIIMFAVGLPLFFLELAIGQFSSLGMISVWKMSPIFKGVGYAMTFLSIVICFYYNVIVTYAVYYMMVALVNYDAEMPWERCNHEWNTQWCMVDKGRDINATLTMHRRLCPEKLTPQNIIAASGNRHFCGYNNFTTPSLEYWTNFVLHLPTSNGIGDLGPVSTKNTLFLFATWVFVYVCVKEGIKPTGKMIYFTMIFPYIILTVLFIHGLTLEGYSEGIKYFIIPKWEKFMDIKVWCAATTQVLFSLGIGFGPLINMASHSKFKSNCYRDAVLVTLIDCGTSIYGGLVIFSFLGNMAHSTGQQMDTVIKDGNSLLFVVYPDGISGMAGAGIWSVFFFFTIISLGIESEFAILDAVVTTIIDELPLEARKWRSLICGIICLFCFLIGISMVSGGGIYVLTLMDRIANSYSVMFISIMELIAVNWFYGFRDFKLDVKMMLGYTPGIYWKATWIYISPIASLFILIMSCLENTPLRFEKYVFEDWAQVLCWIITIIPILTVIITGVVQVFKYDKDIRKACRPCCQWGPALVEDHVERYEFSHVQTIRLMPFQTPPNVIQPECYLEDISSTEM